jgi:hypothetical protein
MNIVSMVFIWFGSAMLFTFALCWAARGPIPQPGFPDEALPSGSSDNPSQSIPTNL